MSGSGMEDQKYKPESETCQKWLMEMPGLKEGKSYTHIFYSDGSLEINED